MQTIEVLVEGGKATPSPPLGPTLAQLKINVGDVVKEINEKTKQFTGMQVPVKISINEDKSFNIEVGVPPVTSLIKKELRLEKGSQHPGKEEIADIHIEQIIKIAKAKEQGMHGDIKARVKQIVGTCLSMGILVEGKHPKDVLKDIENGIYDKEIMSGKTKLTEEELKMLEKEKKKLLKELEKKKEEERKKAEEIINSMKTKDRIKIKHALEEADISKELIDELLEKLEKE